MDQQYQKGKAQQVKVESKPQAIAQQASASGAASDLVKAVVSRRLAQQKKNKSAGLPADYGMVQTKGNQSILDEAKRNEEIVKNAKDVKPTAKPII